MFIVIDVCYDQSRRELLMCLGRHQKKLVHSTGLFSISVKFLKQLDIATDTNIDAVCLSMVE